MKYLKMLLTAGLLTGILTTSLLAQDTAFFPDEMVVSATALNLREKPDKQSAKVTTLKRGDVVQVVEAYNKGEYMEVDSVWGPWLKVRYQGKTGYAFGAHLSGTIELHYEGDIVTSLPPLQWYGVYRRDSFADEVRKIDVRLKEEFNEFYGGMVKTLKTNQKDASKFIIGTLKNMKTGFAGPLGAFEVSDYVASGDLGPGAMVGIHPGNELNDTTIKSAYTLAAIGCARLEDLMVKVSDYHLLLMDYATQPPSTQDLTDWFKTMSPDVNPNVTLTWYGDLDMDNKPDAIIDDCPYETGCRASLFLSAGSKPGTFMRKVCEHLWGGD